LRIVARDRPDREDTFRYELISLIEEAPLDKTCASHTKSTPRDRWWCAMSPKQRDEVVGSIPSMQVRLERVGGRPDCSKRDLWRR
jgi:hypothetical protein